MVAKEIIEDLKGDEKGRQEAELDVSHDCWGSPLEDTVTDELHDPAENMSVKHEPELSHSKVQFILLSSPSDVTDDHGRAPPYKHTKSYLPVDEEIAHTDDRHWDRPEADFISENGYIQSVIELSGVAYHHVGCVYDDRHEDDMNELVRVLVGDDRSLSDRHGTLAHEQRVDGLVDAFQLV